jgi:hypothetical protein
VAFDGAGNLWVANDNTSTIVEYLSSSLGASSSPTPTVTLQLADASVYWLALAFDAKGDLWAVEEDSAAIVEYTASQLTSSGTLAAPGCKSTRRSLTRTTWRSIHPAICGSRTTPIRTMDRRLPATLRS